MAESRGGRRADVSGTVGAFTMGDNSSVSDVTVTQGAVAPPKADEIVQLIQQIKAALDASGLADYSKRDARLSIEELERELENPDDEKRRSGVVHWVRRIKDAVADSGVVDLVTNLAALLGVAA